MACFGLCKQKQLRYNPMSDVFHVMFYCFTRHTLQHVLLPMCDAMQDA